MRLGKGGFARISELAKRASVLASTIRHYTEFGLLHPAMDTEGGHRLYDVEVCLKKLRLIQALSRRGKSLPEIREELKRRASILKVLVVDDEEEVLNFIRDIFVLVSRPGQASQPRLATERLSKESTQPKNPSQQAQQPQIELEVARDGFTAGKKYADFFPDLIILDLMLPGMDGFKVCQMIREDPDMAEVKILAITGYDTPEHEQKIRAAGANGYLAKPFAIKEFLGKLQELGILEGKAKT